MKHKDGSTGFRVDCRFHCRCILMPRIYTYDPITVQVYRCCTTSGKSAHIYYPRFAQLSTKNLTLKSGPANSPIPIRRATIQQRPRERNAAIPIIRSINAIKPSVRISISGICYFASTNGTTCWVTGELRGAGELIWDTSEARSCECEGVAARLAGCVTVWVGVVVYFVACFIGQGEARAVRDLVATSKVGGYDVAVGPDCVDAGVVNLGLTFGWGG